LWTWSEGLGGFRDFEFFKLIENELDSYWIIQIPEVIKLAKATKAEFELNQLNKISSFQ